MNFLPDTCYNLPWSDTDNPNGWIEPTTDCNLKCPGCYRGIDRRDHIPVYLPLQEVIEQIDWFIKYRNIHTLSISGGEPLLYQQLTDVIKYAALKSLRVMVYTNGVALSKEMLISLRDAGATQVVVHIDRYQDRPDKLGNISVAELQQKYCDLFRETGGILLGFIQPLSSDYREDIQSVSHVAYKNIDVVGLLAFTLYRDICWEKHMQETISAELSMQETIRAFSAVDGFVPAAYLGSVNDKEDPTWVFGARVSTGKDKLGYFSPSFYKLIQERYRRRHGKYLFSSRKNNIKMVRLLQFLRYKCIREIWLNYVDSIFSHGFTGLFPVYFQTILILRGPEKRENEWDLCQGCPDKIFHNGRLVPSCILEDIKTKNTEKIHEVEHG